MIRSLGSRRRKEWKQRWMKFCLLHEEGTNTDINTETLKEKLELARRTVAVLVATAEGHLLEQR